MEGKYAVKLSIPDIIKMSRKLRKHYYGRLWKTQMWSDSFLVAATPLEDNNSKSPKTDGGACAARSPTGGTTPTSTKGHKLGDPQHYSPNSTLVTVNM